MSDKPRKNLAPGGHLVTERLNAGQKSELPVCATLNQDLIFDDMTFKKGAKVVVKLLPNENKGKKIAFQVTEFKKDSAFNLFQPETWMGKSSVIEFEDDVTKEKKIKTVAIRTAVPSDIFNFKNQHYLRHHGALFPSESSPKLDEIKQLGMPDCFLLAGIQSILNHPNGQAFIRGMMFQNDDGTTTVRLFNTQKNAFEYIKVDNAMITSTMGTFVTSTGAAKRHDALWVHVLESAYAVMAERSGHKKNSAESIVYSGGGNSGYAVTVLTGLSSEHSTTPGNLCDFAGYLGGDDNQEKFARVKSRVDEGRLLVQPMVAAGAISEEGRCLKMAGFVVSEIFPIDGAYEMIADFFTPMTQDEALANFYRLFEFYLDQSALYDEAIKKGSASKIKKQAPEVAALLESILTRSFPQSYRKSEIDVFEQLEKALKDEGGLVTSGTPAVDGFRSSFSDMRNGIVRQHAYTILKVFEKPAEDDPQKRVKYVRLRNPWGWMGREYDEDMKGSYALGADTSDVELSEFCRFFSDYKINQSANTLFAHDAKRESLIEMINVTLDNWQVSYDSSSEALAEAKLQFKRCEDALFNCALSELDLLSKEVREKLSTDFSDVSLKTEAAMKEKFEQAIDEVLADKNQAHSFYWLGDDQSVIKARMYALFRVKAGIDAHTKLSKLPQELYDALYRVMDSSWSGGEAECKTSFNAVLGDYCLKYADALDDFAVTQEQMYDTFKHLLALDNLEVMEPLRVNLIENTPRPPQWAVLEQHRAMLDVIGSVRDQSHAQLKDDFDALWTQLIQRLEPLLSEYKEEISSKLDNDTCQLLLKDFIALEQVYLRFTTTSDLNRSLSHQELAKMASSMQQDLNHLKTLLDTSSELVQAREEKQEDIDAALDQVLKCAHDISKDDTLKIQAAARILSPDLSSDRQLEFREAYQSVGRMGAAYQASDVSGVRVLGQKLINLEQSAQKEEGLFLKFRRQLSRLVKPVASFFKTANNKLGLLFNTKNESMLDHSPDQEGPSHPKWSVRCHSALFALATYCWTGISKLFDSGVV